MYADDEEVIHSGPRPKGANRKRRRNPVNNNNEVTGLQHLKISSKKDHEEEPFEESTPLAEQNEISKMLVPGSMGENLDQSGARTAQSAMGEIPPQLPTMGAFGLTRSDPMQQMGRVASRVGRPRWH